MALTIPEEELEICKRLVMPAFAVLSLTNDLYSWEKERDAARRAGIPFVVNAIWVLMKEHSMDEMEAKNLCRIKIKEYVINALSSVEDAKAEFSISKDLRTYVEAVLYSISGNLVWSIYCPRYHSLMG